MKTSDFYYDLPPELIAQTPAQERSASRLLVYDRKTKTISDEVFSDITRHLHPGDVLVRNTTRVIPARLFGTRPDTGGKMEVLLLKRLDAHRWECLVRPGRRAKPGLTYVVSDALSATICEPTDAGGRVVRFAYDGVFEEILDRVGEMPLPPYITQRLSERERYQTVYSKINGSAAAPTAGLHFTQELLDKLAAKGVREAYITLHVGLGTFRPVKAEEISEHHMHSEFCMISKETADIINETKRAGGRIVCVGTTSCRTLESLADENGYFHEASAWTDIFIYPGYKFKAMNALITNFHLPESTLVMLVSAFADREKILNAYNIAVQERYRFFSFGDAMFIS